MQIHLWLWALDLRLQKLQVLLPASLYQRNNLGQVVHTRVPLVTEQYNWVPVKGR